MVKVSQVVATIFFFVALIAVTSSVAQAGFDCVDVEAICRDDCQMNEQQVGYCNGNLSKCCKARVATEQMVSSNIDNPLELNTVEDVLDSVLGSLQAIIAILSIIFIVIGGILYMTAAGDEGRVRTAKGAITAAMVGLALGIGAPSFLKQIGEVLGWGAIDSGPVADAETLAGIATNVLNFLLSVVGIIGIIMLVIGGLMYLTAAGDEDRINTGKKIVNYSIIGIAVALAALVIVTQIAKFFSGA